MSTKKHTDGNVGVEQAARRGTRSGDICLYVDVDGYKHRLFLTLDEADRAADLLDQLLEELGR